MTENQTNKVVQTVSPTQMEFIGGKDDYTVFCGGIRSGKTHAGALWAAMMVLNYPNTIGAITANSYSQLKRATLQKFFEILTQLGIKFTYKDQAGVIEIGEAKIYTVSMEKYDLLRGVELGWAWSDECAFYKEEAFEVLIGRLSDAKGPCLWKGTTTPNGFNWLYKRFVAEPAPRSSIIYARTLDNAGNLRDGYVENLLDQYDAKRAEQELNGQFVNLDNGLVYYNFDRRVHVQEFGYDDRYVFVGLDFNVDPMCGVIAFERQGVIYVAEEIYLRNSNTFAAAKEICKKTLGKVVRVAADDTGDRRRSSSNTTDHEILRRAGLEVLKFRNPRVRDRYNNINRLLYHKRIVIHPRCTKLIQDLEQMTYENLDPLISHIGDALGYVTWHLEPLKKKREGTSVTYY